MAYGNEGRQRAAGEETQSIPCEAPTHASRIDQWIQDIQQQRTRIQDLRNLLFNYRTALDGPVPESIKPSNAENAERDVNPSKLSQMQQALEQLEHDIGRAFDEFEGLNGLRIVDLNDSLY